MNWVDYLIILLLLVEVWTGFRGGLVRHLFSLLGLAAGLLLGLLLYGSMLRLLEPLVPLSLEVLRVVSFLLVFFAVMGVSSYLGSFLTRSQRQSGVGMVDALGGAALNAVVSFLILSLSVSLFFGLEIGWLQGAMENSMLAPPMENMAEGMLSLLAGLVSPEAWEDLFPRFLSVDLPYDGV